MYKIMSVDAPRQNYPNPERLKRLIGSNASLGYNSMTAILGVPNTDAETGSNNFVIINAKVEIKSNEIKVFGLLHADINADSGLFCFVTIMLQ